MPLAAAVPEGAGAALLILLGLFRLAGHAA